MYQIKVASYNVLSDSYSTRTSYPACSPSDLDPTVRLSRIFKLLKRCITENSIICLQEVSTSWTASFVSFFEAHYYHFVYDLYGGKASGYMGVAIAYPRYKFSVVSVTLKRVSDLMEERPYGVTEDIFQRAQEFANAVVFTQLKIVPDGPEFGIGTYHMPCLYGSIDNMKIMALHLSFLMAYCQIVSFTKPLIVAGDFNFYPSDSTYQLVYTGSLPPNHPHSVEATFQPMRSAYAELGGEPEYTCVSFNNNDLKTEVLDYIFVSREWNVKQVTRPHTIAHLRTQGVRCFPSEREPSDHVMICAVLELPQ